MSAKRDPAISEKTSIELKLVIALGALLVGVALWVAKVEAGLEKVEPAANALIKVDRRLYRLEIQQGIEVPKEDRIE